MNDVSVIDRFLEVFGLYIDTGFGLLGSEVAFLTMTLVVIDMTLAGLFWAMAGEDVSAKLIRKILYVGAFAFIIGNFNVLAKIVFNSFAGLGLLAAGSVVSPAEFLQPGHLASIGIAAGRPLLDQVRDMSGFPEVFSNIDSILVLLVAWLVVIISFFFLTIQLFVTLIEFKLTTLAGFVLVPFALWNKTAFLAEKVLGNVVASGIKVLVLAVIVGIGRGLFAEFQAVPDDPSIDHALVMMLASLAMLALGIFGPGIATGLVSGAPQLGAGAAAGTALAAGGLAAGAAAAAASAGGALLAGARIVPGAARTLMSTARSLTGAGGASTPDGGTHQAGSSTAPSKQPDWAKRLQRRQRLSQATSTVAHTLRGGDGGGSSTGPQIRDPSNS